jgi:hypothetical protein
MNDAGMYPAINYRAKRDVGQIRHHRLLPFLCMQYWLMDPLLWGIVVEVLQRIVTIY